MFLSSPPSSSSQNLKCEKSPIRYIKFSSLAILPQKGSYGAAGFDLFSAECMTIPPGQRRLVSTDIGIDFTTNLDYFGRLAARSNLAILGIDVGAGIIDSDYQGIIKVLIINNSALPFTIKLADRFAQIIFCKIWPCLGLKEYDKSYDELNTIFPIELENDTDEKSILVSRKARYIKLPELASKNAASYNLFAPKDIILEPSIRTIVWTGISFDFRPNAYGFITGRRSFTIDGIDTSENVVENSLFKELKLHLTNTTKTPVLISAGERIARVTFCEVYNAYELSSCDLFLLKTGRGTAGFGSTGIN
ncbi:uncharacterized protein LOC128397440 [Panonychus citri]|uniref:uncharacterized protein LOC128397047 n=1 Tax=Panonychus citri TaxID=50023 RepID=UPI002307F6F4|nr:uncharacterized protein LOC128397047 [Panonychus citri]XP_053214142.1 uncharacterized protein LOC128397440 [Panonychus citri]